MYRRMVTHIRHATDASITACGIWTGYIGVRALPLTERNARVIDCKRCRRLKTS
jgi:hypothetical protein